ncbi:PilW family protein [Clostridium vincentii]|uniref:Prepilin-type N-terminal cleavage/methylation domain-containing protein n=1 Tax=Clostridium vincentii TaxID=52704 RepID=A0A2T0BC52_9CLOT|nr:prepilin-type N-terminal cleavage/methylation domain-containing protein [Clostridium vincentii]PRR81458.1 hypothetical protein CLVI_24850 [Clostridium vincentii]
MKDKTKGFTLIELMITLAITVIVLGVIYTFSFTSQKILSSTEINAVLQDEGRDIENSLVDIGMQAKGIEKINNQDPLTTNKYSTLISTSNRLSISKISMIYHDDSIYTFELIGTELTLVKGTGSAKILSKNIKQIQIKPLDYNNVDKHTSYVANAPGIEVSITLYKKEGLSEITYPISTILKFRNKGIT